MNFAGSNVLRCLNQLFRGEDTTETGAEYAMAKKFQQIILDAQRNKNVEIEGEDELDFIQSEEEEEFVMTSEEEKEINGFTLDFITTVLTWIDSRKKKPTFETIQKRYPRIKANNYIARFREYYANQGTRNEKMKKITAIVYDKFKQTRIAGITIHDSTIKAWAIYAAKNVDLADFRASDSWITRFKRNNKIVTRRITKFVTKTNTEDAVQIQSNATAVIVELEEYKHVHDITNEQTYNADQCGIEYELHTARTLSFEGEKDTIGLVRSKNAKTHSYTVMPFISMAGKMKEKALICLKEPNGEFGPTVLSRLFKPDNLVICCTASGKMTTALMRKFILEVYSPHVADHSILMIDSWTGQRNPDLYAVDGKTIKTFTIPAGATSIMQPCDLFCFRQWKSFIKKFQERIIMDGTNLVLHDRNNIIRLNSLILNQFQSPLFSNMFKYAWSKGGFGVDIAVFEGLDDICFNFNDYICETCKSKLTFVKCSWLMCRKCLCLKCFYQDYHHHVPNAESSSGSSPANIDWQ